MTEHIPLEIEKVQVKVWFPGGRRIVFRTERPKDFAFTCETDVEDEFTEYLYSPMRRTGNLDYTLSFEIIPSVDKGHVYELYDLKPGAKAPKFEIRPTITEWAVGMAEAASTRGECTRRKVGAIVLDKDHRLVGAGYNGAPAGKASCLTGACPRATSGVEPGSSYDTGAGACIAIHAEANALLDAGRKSRGGELYVSSEICDGCMRLAKGARIAWVHCRKADGTIDSIPIR